jgi:dienelactone hydrolase
MPVIERTPVRIPVGRVRLDGDLELHDQSTAVVAFAHGSGSSRLSPRNRRVAEILGQAGLGTLLFDLLTRREEEEDELTAHFRFDIGLLSECLVAATDWLLAEPATRDMTIGYFGASTGAAAAIRAAAERPEAVHAVVSRGGRPDLAGDALRRLRAPILMIVGGADEPVIRLNEEAAALIHAPKRLEIIPGATHLFEEPGAMDQVALLARNWLTEHLTGTPGSWA